MNKPMKRHLLKKIDQLKEMLKKLTCEVKECYKFGRRSGKFFEVPVVKCIGVK